jgi:hypothetical protein
MRREECSRFAALVAELAQRALTGAPTWPALPNGPGLASARGPESEGAGPADPVAASVLAGVLPAQQLLAAQPHDYAACTHSLWADSTGAIALAVHSARGARMPWLVDAAGHGRDVYFPLVVHLNFAALRCRAASLSPEDQFVIRQALEAALAAQRLLLAAYRPEIESGRTAWALWVALNLAEAAAVGGRAEDQALSEAAVTAVLSRPGPGGSLHPLEASQALDAWTYDELAGLHALANLAMLARNSGWARRVEEVARYHLENTQPDNTTNQPWGVLAFAWSAGTRSFAEQQLHDATAHGALTGLGRGLAGMLLADAAAGLRELA